jgi:hypothetical protein
MSGQDGIRGYVFQSVYAVLESLQTEWEYICIEPNTNNDKIDIIWTDKTLGEKVCQVKSSINDFSKTEILTWLYDLYKENSTAVSYSIILIGNSSSSNKSYFKGIKELPQNDFEEKYKDLFLIRDKIKIEFYNLNYSTLKAATISCLDRFLSLNDINIDYFTKELIYGGILNQFMYFSTSGRKISKTQFEDELMSWLLHNYSKQIAKSNFEILLSFYITGINKFEDSISALSIPDITTTDLIKNQKVALVGSYKKVLSYQVKNSIKPNEANNPIGELLMLPSLNEFRRTMPPYKNEPVIISEREKNVIRKKVKLVLEIDIPDVFFEFGDLKETKNGSLFTSWNNTVIFSGNENEKNKYEAYQEFEFKLYDLSDLLNFWSEIQKFKFLPIVLNNFSKSYEKGLRTKLYFPKEVTIITPRDFPSPKRIENIKELNDVDNILSYWLKHHKDSKVNEYSTNSFALQAGIFETSYSLHMMSDLSVKKSMREDQFYRILEYYFDFEVFFDDPEKTILECSIDELSANESISLPSYIFYETDNDFEIEYEINSKNLSKKIKGVLNIKQ